MNYFICCFFSCQCFAIILSLLIFPIQQKKKIALLFYLISKFANFAISLLCPAFSKFISSFKSSPSCSTEFITPSPNFLWYTVTPALNWLKSTPSVFVLFNEFKKLSAVLNWYDGSFGEYLSPNAFVCYFFTVPYSHSYVGSFGSYCFSFLMFLSPFSISGGISSINLDILLHDVEPNIVLCLLHVKYKNCSALVSPT